MARFNTVAKPKTKTVNFAGGEAYKQSPELELVSILLTSFASDQFYRSASDNFEQVKNLITKCDKKFVAQAAIYARTKFGMRSISHVVASELAKHISGEIWAKDFYKAVIYRPDDMSEILAYHTSKNGKIPNAIKKGFAKAFDKFDKYALAKYRGENKGFKLVDIVNLVHPSPIESNKEAINALIKGELKSFDTWETELTKAGQVAESDEQKDELKKDAWKQLIETKKIGYFALLRNLRNIIEQAPEVVPQALEMLVNEKLIRKALILPFQFVTAYDEIQKLNSGASTRNTLVYLTKAIDIALANIPKFEGDTLVVLDTSSSMTSNMNPNNKTSPAKIGSLFAAVLVKANNADLITFDSDARYVNLNPLDSAMTLTNSIKHNGGSTNFHSIFQRANKKYDRIIILSDMQGWVGYNTPKVEYNTYKKSTGANPFLYSFDLNSYGSLQFPEQNVFALAGFSEKIFDVMKLLEQDKQALVNTIKAVEF